MNADLTNFVVAAYAAAFIGIGGYAAGLALRLSWARRRLAETEHTHKYEAAAEIVAVAVPSAKEVQHVG